MKPSFSLFAAALAIAGAAFAQEPNPAARSQHEAQFSPPTPQYAPPTHAAPPAGVACPTCGSVRQAQAYAPPAREIVRVVYVEPVTWAPAYGPAYYAPRPPLDPFGEVRVNAIPWPPGYGSPRICLPAFARCR